MITLLGSFCHIAIVTIAIGHLLVLLFKRVGWMPNDTKLNFDVISVLGFSGLSVFLNITSFFTAISPVFQGVFSLVFGGVFFYFFSKNTFQIPPISLLLKACIILFLGVFLLESAKLAVIGDTGLYHIASIKWSEEYPIVKGLANLHARLASNSNIFPMAAFFGERHVWGQVITGINPYLFLLMGYRILVEVQAWNVEKNWGLSLFYSFYLGLCFFQLKAFIASNSPDLSVAVFNFYLIFIFLMPKKRLNSFSKIPLIAVLAFALPTYKLSCILSVFVALFWAISEGI